MKAFGIKILALLGTVVGFLGMLMAIKIPGNLAFIPLFFGLVFGIAAYVWSKKKNIECVSCLLAISLSVIGILMTLFIQLTEEPEVAKDKVFEEKLEQSAEETEQSDELDDALDELDFE